MAGMAENKLKHLAFSVIPQVTEKIKFSWGSWLLKKNIDLAKINR